MNEKIEIDGKILQYGVLTDDDGGYQLYVYPGMSVAELAFDVMVTIRLLMKEGYLKDEKDFVELIYKYFNDPQYAPLEKSDGQDTSNNIGE